MRDILYPARRLHGLAHSCIIKSKTKNRIKKYIKYPQGGKAIVFGTPTHNNIGDSAIALAEMSFLQQCFGNDKVKEITVTEYQSYSKIFEKYFSSSCHFFGMGGGNLGDQWFGEELFRRHFIIKQLKFNPVLFPQTIYYTDTPGGRQKEKESIDVYNNSSITLVAREKKSYEIMKDLYPLANVLLTPDIVLSAKMDIFGATEQVRSGVLLCLRSDPEKAVSDDIWSDVESSLDQSKITHSRTDMMSDVQITKENRCECVRRKMQEFCEAELVITDRLHGMVFAAITGTPCIVFSNYNHKVKGTYDWISYLPYIRYVETVEEAKAAIPELLKMKNCHYDNSPLMPFFDKLAKVIKEKCQI